MHLTATWTLKHIESLCMPHQLPSTQNSWANWVYHTQLTIASDYEIRLLFIVQFNQGKIKLDTHFLLTFQQLLHSRIIYNWCYISLESPSQLGNSNYVEISWINHLFTEY